MKNFIMYYYKIDDISLYKINNKYEFKYNGKKYIFMPIMIDSEELNEILNIKFNKNMYNKIIVNKDKMPISNINGINYILLKEEIPIDTINIGSELKKTIYIKNGKYKLDRSNCCMLWSKKIDYFEYQMSHIENKYKFIEESIDYYIGMTESAISYIKEADDSDTDEKESLCICHKRINKIDFYNPFNIVFDHKSRDISEYLKYIFIENNYQMVDIETFIKELNLTNYGYKILYGRMFYPSFYFDMYEKIINENTNENEMLKIVERVDEYEQYIDRIYQAITRIIKIPKINWI